jgi:CubicO group peptidase (beta-lactamase class C family)
MRRIKNIALRVNDVLDRAKDDAVFPGYAAALIVDDQYEIITSGRFTFEPESAEITADSVYDVASLTKAIPVSCCALKLVEQKKLALDDLLISYVPQFSGSFRGQITIHHLLTHTLDSDLRLSMCKDDHPDVLLGKILNLQLRTRPGERFNYSNATSILLGLVLESCTGKTLDVLGDEFFFKPLGMNRTGFSPMKFATLNEIVPTEVDSWRGGIVIGQVHDESAWKLLPRVAGSAGLFSTITDITLFIRKLLDSFITDDGLFTKQIAAEIVTNQIDTCTGQCTGLGWELNQESYMGGFRTEVAFGKTGFTGCSIVADPGKMCAGVLLSNHIYPHRRDSRVQINRIRSLFADCIFSGS